MRETVNISEVVEFLNHMLKIDPAATNALFSLRVSCNQELAAHPTIQVGLLGGSHPIVGLIGIVNGMFGVDKNKWGHISADYDDGQIIRFRLLSENDTTEHENKRAKERTGE